MHLDNRSYSVDFTKYQQLAKEFQPIISLEQSILRLKENLIKIKFSNLNFRNQHL